MFWNFSVQCPTREMYTFAARENRLMYECHPSVKVKKAYNLVKKNP